MGSTGLARHGGAVCCAGAGITGAGEGPPLRGMTGAGWSALPVGHRNFFLLGGLRL
jgi:hypothetical protein